MSLKKEELFVKWQELARDDLKIAKFALENKILLQCAFHCQQAVEKMLKGLIIQLTDKEPPYSHDLNKLLDYLSETPFYNEKYSESFFKLNPFYIQARYPQYKTALSLTLTQETCEYFYKLAEGILLWKK